ncbi:putative bifunctional diguanylate cyclase/phosphodiesterase [Cognatiyoonia sp. IB215182]|uniref:putative bifunctional diguanylate cyclase/phosphodiesterase n=1 Tax=Cognatiyoonia sp. IB215182 TaxID=3097353 RepID=UPI002A106CDF|nr:EAL domain-containing protein [Cognatiyoonia sp. IB215182]MDX8354690.1 EAL domain-containing protein [Cognatiyoonia sp. IB215182]
MDRISAAFLRRGVVFGCVIAIVGTCLFAGYYVQATVNQLQLTHRSFNDRQLRNGYVALSDVQRLVLIMQNANGQRRMTPEAAEDFRVAADFLYVRTDTFQRVQITGGAMETANDAIAALRHIQALADDAIATNFDDLPYLSEELTRRAQSARQALVRYLDEMRQLQDQLLARQSKAVANQRTVIWVTLFGLSVLGIAATMLLRWEVIAKRARQAAEARVNHLAFFDPLTGLPNRVQFQDRLSSALAKGRKTGLLLIDLDGFKYVNDTHGHAAGDAILCHVASAIQSASALQSGLAARLGGDEFAIILPSDDLQLLKKVSEDVIDAIRTPVFHDGEKLQVAASIGIATDMESDSDALMRAADFALYASKSDGKGRYTIYDGTLARQFLERRQMIEDLPAAITNGDLDFFLQPKVNLQTGQVFGFEALARWRRNGVIVPPKEFISVAEESSQISDIDCRLLRDATQHLARFNAENGTAFSISINFSTIHFSSTKLVQIVSDALNSSRLPPELLTIEITETAEMHDWARAKKTIEAINQMGVRVSIDDFGTGFSSLAYLRRTFADEVKIDRSLVTDIVTSDPSRFLLDAVLDIARNLELDVIVEGIETRAQVDLIRAMGAKYAQGFYFGRPMPSDEALAAALARNAGPSESIAS